MSNYSNLLFIYHHGLIFIAAVPSGMRLEFSGAFSGNMKVSFQAARSIG